MGQVNRIRIKHRQIKTKICQLINITDQEYFWFITDTGILYLRDILKLDKFSIEQMTSNKIFWNWWKQQWINRDEQFIKKYPLMRSGKRILRAQADRDRIRNFYLRDYHKIEHLPCYLIQLEDAYDKMIQQIIQEIHEQKYDGKRQRKTTGVQAKTQKRVEHTAE